MLNITDDEGYNINISPENIESITTKGFEWVSEENYRAVNMFVMKVFIESTTKNTYVFKFYEKSAPPLNNADAKKWSEDYKIWSSDERDKKSRWRRRKEAPTPAPVMSKPLKKLIADHKSAHKQHLHNREQEIMTMFKI